MAESLAEWMRTKGQRRSVRAGVTLAYRVTGVRIMDANASQGARAVYMNEAGQTVNPFTGRTVSPSDPSAHWYFNPKP